MLSLTTTFNNYKDKNIIRYFDRDTEKRINIILLCSCIGGNSVKKGKMRDEGL